MTLIDSNALGSLAATLDTARIFNLDTIGFGRLVDNARSQIPRFAPEWTDHNLHDPGITIIDLLAWIVDQQIYRVGFVNDRQLAAYAALLGERPSGPTPATGLIWPDAAAVQQLLVPAGRLQVTSNLAPGVPFAVDRDLLISDAILESAALASSLNDGSDTTPLSLRRGGPSNPLNLSGFGPGGPVAAIVLNFDRPLAAGDGGPVSIGFELDDRPGTPAGGSAAGAPAWGPLTFDYRVGDEEWGEAAIVSDDTGGLTQTGIVEVSIPGREGSEPSSLRVRFDRGFFPVNPSVRHIATNVIPIVQREVEVPPGAIAEGNGQPDQSLTFDQTGLLAEPVISVDGERWDQQADFCRSGPDDRHYLLERNQLIFGNGVNGAIPASGASIKADRIERSAGRAGNVRADLGWTVAAPDPLFVGRNCLPVSGGADAAEPTDLLAAARAVATERRGLLSDDDLAAAALQLAGFFVARADVVAGYDPRLPGRSVPGTRSLVVFPQREQGDELRPVPAPYLEAIDTALAGRRVMGDRLLVLAPEVVPVAVHLSLVIEPGSQAEEVAARARAELMERLAVIDRTPSTDRDAPGSWPLGRPLTVEEVRSAIIDVEGVLIAGEVLIGRAGATPTDQPLELPRHGVAVLADLDLELRLAGGGLGGKQR